MTSAHVSVSAVDREMDIFTVVESVWRQKWIMVVVAGVLVIAAVIYSLALEPVYRAEVVVVERHDDGMEGAALSNQLGGIASMVGLNLGPGGSSNNGKAVLNSQRLSQEFITRYIPLDRLFEGSSAPRTLWRGVKYFRKSILDIRDDNTEGKTTVGIAWTDPATAARWANDYVALANELVRKRAIDESSRNIRYLNEQLEKSTVVELRKVLYNLVETETKKLMLANGRAEYAFTVVDPAVAPEIRSSPKRTLIVAAAGIIGVLVGSLFALAWDVISRRRASRTPGL